MNCANPTRTEPPERSKTKKAYTEQNQQELFELAGHFDPTFVGRGRDEHGRLADWNTWAKSHPHRDETLRVCHGRTAWQRATPKSSFHDDRHHVSVVSWNTLSDTWYSNPRYHGLYDHVPPNVGVWERRFPLLLQWIEDLQPDVLALQEVDFEKFHQDFLPEMQTRGYMGVMQSAKSHNDQQPCGVATFWKRDHWKLVKSHSRSRSMVVLLENILTKSTEEESQSQQSSSYNQFLCLINAHLECSQTREGAEKRARQLNSPLLWAHKEAPQCPLVVCGDFNTGADASLFYAIRHGTWHGHNLASVYEHPQTSETLPVNRGSFFMPQNHYVIDHILYSHSTATPRLVLNAFSPEEINQHLGNGLDRGFPDGLCPSDHIPVGAVFELTAATESSTSDTRRRSASLSIARQEEIQQQWQELRATKPIQPKRKPTSEEIVLLKDHADRVKAWRKSFESTTEEERDFVAHLVKGKS